MRETGNGKAHIIILCFFGAILAALFGLLSEVGMDLRDLPFAEVFGLLGFFAVCGASVYGLCRILSYIKSQVDKS